MCLCLCLFSEFVFVFNPKTLSCCTNMVNKNISISGIHYIWHPKNDLKFMWIHFSATYYQKHMQGVHWHRKGCHMTNILQNVWKRNKHNTTSFSFILTHTVYFWIFALLKLNELIVCTFSKSQTQTHVFTTHFIKVKYLISVSLHDKSNWMVQNILRMICIAKRFFIRDCNQQWNQTLFCCMPIQLVKTESEFNMNSRFS